jgi:hypothetical protein
MPNTDTVHKAVSWASQELLHLVSRGHLPTLETVDVMAAEIAGDACEKFRLDHGQWNDHVWEMVRMEGQKRLREMDAQPLDS